MARRVPVSAATREYDKLVGHWGGLEGFLDVETVSDAGSLDLSAQTVPPEARGSYDALVYSLLNDEFLLNPEEIVMLSRWRRCRHVYRIDPEVAEQIGEQGLDGELPVDALRRLPYPIVFIDSPVTTFRGSAPVRRDGFFAWVDHRLGHASDDALYLCSVGGGKRSLVRIRLSDETLRDVVDDLFSGDEEMREKVSYRDEMELVSADRAEAQLAHVLNLLLYVISAEDDAEVTYRPPSGQRGQRPGRRTNPETHHLLGARMGRAIGAAKAVAFGSAKGDGSRTVSPHVRRAHWQHFWTGRRKGRDDGRFGDELVVRWVPPIFVNGDGEAVEVVHEG